MKQLPVSGLAALLMAAACLLSSPQGAAAQQAPPTFTPGDCPIARPEGVEVSCGRLTVLEDRDKPQGRTIDLWVMILHSSAANPQPDPVIYLEGGPGGSIALGGAWLGLPFLAERDFILMEQRGNQLSDPWLACPAYDEAFIDALATFDSPQVEAERISASMAACRDAFRAEGIDLSQYASEQTAADYADLRAVLGYDEWNLYGISYGTRLALTVMRDHPEGLRAVVLDSVYPPVVNTYTDTPADFTANLGLVAGACAADAACAEAYPDPLEDYRRAVARLNEEPAAIHAAGRDLLISGEDLRIFSFVAIYNPATISMLPLLWSEVAAGRTSMLGPLLDGLNVYLYAVSDGKYYAVECREELPFNLPEEIAAAEAAYPDAPLMLTYHTAQAVCADWGAEQARPVESEPVRSDLPVLLMAGELDSSTPARWALLAAESLPNSQVLIFPNSGHAVSPGPCGAALALAFISDPAAPLDRGCLNSIPPVDFISGEDFLLTPLPYRLSGAFLGGIKSAGVLLIGGLLLMLVEGLLSPLVLLRLLRAGWPSADRWMRAAFMAAGLAITLGTGGLLAALVPLIRANPLLIAVGLPRSAAPAAGLFGLGLLISAGLPLLAGLAWRRKAWDLATRIHCTAIAAGGLCCLAALLLA